MRSGPRRPKPKELPNRINQAIRAREVRVVDEEGNQLGVMVTDKAIKLAQSKRLDLVEVAEKAEPPVCRILNYGKFLYDKERKEKAARKHRQKPPHQIRLRPNIADNDYQTKCNQIAKFIDKGEKVKVSVMFKGRQGSHPELGHRLLERLIADLDSKAQVEHAPRQEGASIFMQLAPLKDLNLKDSKAGPEVSA